MSDFHPGCFQLSNKLCEPSPRLPCRVVPNLLHTDHTSKPDHNFRFNYNYDTDYRFRYCASLLLRQNSDSPSLIVQVPNIHTHREFSLLASLLLAGRTSMVYTMEIYIDGACRNNGKPGAVGAAAAVFKTRFGGHKAWTKILPRYPPPTSQRAEITAVILALEQALARFDELRTNPYLDIKIYSDSRYVVGCMTDWVYKWSRNGWINAAGNEVANRDLIQKASDLDDRLKEEGDVQYIWIPREKNEDADEYCRQALDDEF